MEQKTPINVEELRKGGVVQVKGKDMFSLWVKTSCCNLNSEQLRKCADIADQYGRGFILFTTRQNLVIPFIPLKNVDTARSELQQVYLELDRCGPRVRNVNVCYEDKVCSQALSNPLSLAEKLDHFFYSDIQHKIKLGVSGCPRDCTYCRVLTDIGFIATGAECYEVYVGGRLGLNPTIGVKMATELTERECVKLVQNYFDLLQVEGQEGERSADLINRLGMERVREKLNENLHAGTPQPIRCRAVLEDKPRGKEILRIRALGGEVTTQQARKIAEVAERFGEGIIHFTVRGSPEIPGVAEENLRSIEEELKTVSLRLLQEGIDNLQTCYGDYCTNSLVNTQSLLQKIEKLVSELGIDDPSVTVSASGCPNSCGISHLSDLGFMGVLEPEVNPEECRQGCQLCVRICKRKAISKRNGVAVIDPRKCGHCAECLRSCPFEAIREKRRGYAVLVGGRGAGEPRLGKIIAEFVSEGEALRLAENELKKLKEGYK